MNPSILLCCVHPFSPTEEISNQKVFKLISKFGKVNDLVMFTKGKTWKFFVEMASETDLEAVLSSLRKVSLKIGKVNVYKSNKKKLKKHKTYIVPKIKKETYKKNSFVLTSDSNSENDFFNIYLKSSIFKISKDHFLQEEIYDENQFLDANTNLNDISKVNKIIFLKLDNVETVNCQILLNVFGCFGNIKKLFFNKIEKFCLIEFQTVKQAEMAFKNLENLFLFQNLLKLALLPFSALNSSFILQFQNKNKILMQGHYKYYRYKKGLNIKINPPSNILHLTSISKKLCPIILYEIINNINTAVKIIKLGKKGTNSNMFLVCFENIEKSMEVLSVLHNKKIDKKILKVSFSHTKFD